MPLRLESLLDYHFNNPQILERALTHQSANSDSSLNASQLEFIGASSLYLAICHQLTIKCPIETGATEMIESLDRITLSILNLSEIFKAPDLKNSWQIRSRDFEKDEERIWFVYALAGALFLDGGYQAVTKLALIILLPWNDVLGLVNPQNAVLPWGNWPYRQTIRLESIEAAFPRSLSIDSYKLLPWAMETHFRPGTHNKRSYQLFELGEAALRWNIDFRLFQNGNLEPLEYRCHNRERLLKSLGLQSRQDQIYASSFSSQDWRRQSSANRTQSLKNILAAVLVSSGEEASSAFSQLILKQSVVKTAAQSQNSSIVVSPAP